MTRENDRSLHRSQFFFNLSLPMDKGRVIFNQQRMEMDFVVGAKRFTET
jgi:hypothetical protein